VASGSIQIFMRLTARSCCLLSGVELCQMINGELYATSRPVRSRQPLAGLNQMQVRAVCSPHPPGREANVHRPAVSALSNHRRNAQRTGIEYGGRLVARVRVQWAVHTAQFGVRWLSLIPDSLARRLFRQRARNRFRRRRLRHAAQLFFTVIIIFVHNRSISSRRPVGHFRPALRCLPS